MNPITPAMSCESLSTLGSGTTGTKMSSAETTPPSTRTGSPNRTGSQVCPETPARTPSPTILGLQARPDHVMQQHARITLGFLERVSFLSEKGFVALNGDTLEVPGLVAVAK